MKQHLIFKKRETYPKKSDSVAQGIQEIELCQSSPHKTMSLGYFILICEFTRRLIRVKLGEKMFLQEHLRKSIRSDSGRP